MYLLKMLFVAIIALRFSAMSVAANEAANTVNVPDPNLRQLILEIKNRYAHKSDEITQEDLQNIYFLNANGKAIRDLTGLEHCNNLGEARFAGNAIVDVAPLSSCGSLQSLDLSRNKIVDVSPLGKITKLQYLNLAHNHLESLDGLEKLQALNSLYAANNRIESIEPLRQLKRLWSLDLSRNRIKDISPAKLLPRLSSLWLADNDIADLTSLNFHTTTLTTDLRRNKIVEVKPLVTMTQDDDEDRRQYLPFWKLYLAENPLSASARDDLTTLAKLGVHIDLTDRHDTRPNVSDEQGSDITGVEHQPK